MKLNGLYEFSELTQVEGIFVSSGRERSSGKLIQIHLFPAGKSEDANRICQRLFSVPDEVRNKILKYGLEGSASYFVTEPLAPGEGLQSWIERQSVVPAPSAAAPEMSQHLTGQLRQMGIVPAPLAAMMPGPENILKGEGKVIFPPSVTPVAEKLPAPEAGEFTRIYGRNDLLPTPPATGVDTGFNRVYGEAAAIHETSSPEPAPMQYLTKPVVEEKRPPGLETFLGLRPGSPPAPEPQAAPQPEAVRFEELPRVQFSIPAPELLHESQPVAVAPARPERITAPPVVKPIARQAIVDWKTVLIVAAILLALAAVVVAITESAA